MLKEWNELTPRQRDAWIQNHVYPDKPVVADDWPCGYETGSGLYEAWLFRAVADDESGCYPERGPVIACSYGWPPDATGYASVQPVPFYSTEDMDALCLAEDLREHHGLYVKIILRPDDHAAPHKYYCQIEDRRRQWCYHINGTSFADVISLCTYLSFEEVP